MAWEIGNPIPGDWGEEADGWAVGLFLFPNSPRWGLIVRTVLRTLSRGRFWRRDSGTIIDAQDAGRLAYMSFTYVSFQSLLDAINGLKDAVESQTTQVTVDGVCCDQVTPPVEPTPPPQPLPDEDSATSGDIPPNYTDVADYLSELCLYANALHWQVRAFLDFMTKLDTLAAVVTVIVALLGLIFPEPATTAIGGVTLVTIVTVLVTVDGGLTAVALWAEDALPFWDGKQEEFVCFVYQKVFTVDTWKKEVETFVGDALDEVSATFPTPVITTAVSWIEPFLSWMENDIYDRLGTMEQHPTPVSCDACGTIGADVYSLVPAPLDYYVGTQPSWLTIDGNMFVHGDTTDHAGHEIVFQSVTGIGELVGLAIIYGDILAFEAPLDIEWIPTTTPVPGRWATDHTERLKANTSSDGHAFVQAISTTEADAIKSALQGEGYTVPATGSSFSPESYPQPYAVTWKNDAGRPSRIEVYCYLVYKETT